MNYQEARNIMAARTMGDPWTQDQRDADAFLVADAREQRRLREIDEKVARGDSYSLWPYQGQC